MIKFSLSKMINKRAWREGRRGEGERRKKFLRVIEQFECLEAGDISNGWWILPLFLIPLLPVSPSPSSLIPLPLFLHHLPSPLPN